jgi:T4 RnlA family RNA ligase
MKILKYLDFLSESNSIDSNYYLPTYDECRKICDANENLLFFETKHEVDGFPISIFNYRLANWTHFESPIPGNDKIKSYELRGLTFIFNKDGSLFKRYLLLDKFFNLEQTPCSMYSVVKDYKIKNIYNKEDGSIASFIKLPNGRVVGKSKASFISDQSLDAQRIYESDENIKRFVDWSLNNDYVPIFEYVSPKNRIVLKYANTELILLRIRNNKTGEYLDIDDFSDKLDGVSVTSSVETTLDDLVKAKDIVKDKEGWIIQFENGKMVKLKTSWYQDLHSLYTEDINRENTLIKLIIDEQIDDVVSQLDEESEQRIFVEKVTQIVTNEINKISRLVDGKLDEFNYELDGDKKMFSLKYKKNPYFGLIMGIINGREKIESIKNYIKEETKHLMMARNWLKKISETK